jgi:hypothetical protein
MLELYAPPVIGYGELSVRRHFPDKPGDGRGWLTIDRADLRILLYRDLLAGISRIPGPGVRLTKTCACSPHIARLCPHYQGAKLEVRAENRAVIYVIGRPEHHPDCFPAEWPD